MKIYLAGKITGDPEYKRKFAQAAEVYGGTEDAPNAILNPAELPEGMEPGDYMRVCLAMIDACDVAVFLPDWQRSAGAQIERAYCRYVGKTVVDYPEALWTETGAGSAGESRGERGR